MENFKVVAKLCGILAAVLFGWMPGFLIGLILISVLGTPNGSDLTMSLLWGSLAGVWLLLIVYANRIVDGLFKMSGAKV